jgi:hypothetical protein
MTLSDEVRIHLLEHSFAYAIIRRGLEIEAGEVPLAPEATHTVMPGEYYGGSEVMD